MSLPISLSPFTAWSTPVKPLKVASSANFKVAHGVNGDGFDK